MLFERTAGRLRARYGNRSGTDHAALLRQQRHLSHLNHAGLVEGDRHVNPLTYEVDALRALMFVGGRSAYGILSDFVALIISMMVLVAIDAKIYPTVAK